MTSSTSMSMYPASVPAFIRALNNLSGILAKGAAFAAARKIEESVLLNSRLAPDMFALARQVQIATDTAKSGAARLAGAEFPSFENNEITIAQLQTRIGNTIAFLQTLPAGPIDESADKTITWATPTSSRSMQGLPYLLNHLLPNLHFHVTTAYNILRHNGVEIGKKDFLGP